MTEIDPYQPVARLVPRACATERVGNDVVTLDEDRLHFHTMHEQVFRVLRASDGTRSVDEIATMVFGVPDETHVLLTGQALLELMDAGLIVEDAEAQAALYSRRTLGKAAAALLLGGVGLPLVESITAPDSASAQTRCGFGAYMDPCDNYAGNDCLSCCCCGLGSTGLCRPSGECLSLGGQCI